MCNDCGCHHANNKSKSKHNNDLDKSLKEVSDKQNFTEKNTLNNELNLEKKVLEDNDIIAISNRKWFQKNNIYVLNFISSPGSGKTEFLIKSLNIINKLGYKTSVLVGDQQTDNDAKRYLNYNIRAHQINTHSSCHLNAEIISKHIDSFISPNIDFLFIENIGNLVCPAAFDLGEDEKVALLSVTEGEDKPEKYPSLFYQVKNIIISKVDLLKHIPWDKEKYFNIVKKVNPNSQTFFTSALNAEGMDEWVKYLLKKGKEKNSRGINVLSHSC